MKIVIKQEISEAILDEHGKMLEEFSHKAYKLKNKTILGSVAFRYRNMSKTAGRIERAYEVSASYLKGIGAGSE